MSTQSNPVAANTAANHIPSPLDAPMPPAGNPSFGPPVPGEAPAPPVNTKLKQEHPELYEAWAAHVAAGYENNDQVFQRILNALMRSHYSSVIMYWVLFAVGIGFFVAALTLAFRGAGVTSVLFGGLSVVTFLTYFVSRPTQALEENLHFIAWLGIIYNSYWTRLAWSFDEATSQQILDNATTEAIGQLQTLIDKHGNAVRNRPNLRTQVAGQLSGAPQESPLDAATDAATDAGV